MSNKQNDEYNEYMEEYKTGIMTKKQWDLMSNDQKVLYVSNVGFKSVTEFILFMGWGD